MIKKIMVIDKTVNKKFELVTYDIYDTHCTIKSKEYGYCSQLKSNLTIIL